ncbi:phytanoyl-CoA dioxygenase domain-containing protein 1-like isoform X2 [Macrobrachium rosenbergii]|uniref:phytanoyl-CoA dioxygenase domain-containing protein 1-like isoform X2 n=1 Tax=Macrobrachium rosenbergii TaxID=79674 RepID=UPI0034D39D54
MGLMKEEPTTVLSAEQLQRFQTEGSIAVPDFLSEAEVESLRSSCYKLVDEMDPRVHTPTSFSTVGQEQVEKHSSLNKIGHALHWLVPEFKKVSFSDKMKATARQLGFISPAVVQSMYIFKQPGIGGEVLPHKDCTFLSTKPQSCIGFWFALEDVTVENGCLWYSPGSHKTPTERRFIRNPDKNGDLLIFEGQADPFDESKYLPLPVDKGTLVLINGQVDHKSAKNTSPKSRHIYTFHVIERHNTAWDPRNWLQPTPEMPFTGLYENCP